MFTECHLRTVGFYDLIFWGGKNVKLHTIHIHVAEKILAHSTLQNLKWPSVGICFWRELFSTTLYKGKTIDKNKKSQIIKKDIDN